MAEKRFGTIDSGVTISKTIDSIGVDAISSFEVLYVDEAKRRPPTKAERRTAVLDAARELEVLRRACVDALKYLRASA